MHSVLKTEFDELEALAFKKDIDIELLKTEIEEVVFILSEGKMICLTVVKSEEQDFFICYKVDINKLVWAEQEGFRTGDGFILGIEKEILHLFKSRTAYLKYLNLL